MSEGDGMKASLALIERKLSLKARAKENEKWKSTNASEKFPKPFQCLRQRSCESESGWNECVMQTSDEHENWKTFTSLLNVFNVGKESERETFFFFREIFPSNFFLHPQLRPEQRRREHERKIFDVWFRISPYCMCVCSWHVVVVSALNIYLNCRLKTQASAYMISDVSHLRPIPAIRVTHVVAVMWYHSRSLCERDVCNMCSEHTTNFQRFPQFKIFDLWLEEGLRYEKKSDGIWNMHHVTWGKF